MLTKFRVHKARLMNWEDEEKMKITKEEGKKLGSRKKNLMRNKSKGIIDTICHTLSIKLLIRTISNTICINDCDIVVHFKFERRNFFQIIELSISL